MIDIEQDVYDLVSAAAHRVDPNTFVVSKESTRSPSRFPCVSVVEADNSVFRSTKDSGSSENHVSLMYEINIYSNRADGGKKECKQLLEAIDNVLIAKGFLRTMKHPVSMDDATKYRIVVRYTAVSDKNGTIYTR